ncbi:MAG TPA: cupredoxin domain-containing protein [Dehalococcoidia bacterium]|nr:cupredoxin domain-containing protein [Dehalococcoidia bacterium]
MPRVLIAVAAAAAVAVACGRGGGEAPQPTGTPVTSASVRALRGIRFDLRQITVAAGQAITVTLDNQDDGVPHDLVVWRDRSQRERIAGTEQCTGPCQRTVIVPPLPAGRYYFNCTVHPSEMRGDYIVVERSGS